MSIGWFSRMEKLGARVMPWLIIVRYRTTGGRRPRAIWEAGWGEGLNNLRNNATKYRVIFLNVPP